MYREAEWTEVQSITWKRPSAVKTWTPAKPQTRALSRHVISNLVEKVCSVVHTAPASCWKLPSDFNACELPLWYHLLAGFIVWFPRFQPLLFQASLAVSHMFCFRCSLRTPGEYIFVGLTILAVLAKNNSSRSHSAARAPVSWKMMCAAQLAR